MAKASTKTTENASYAAFMRRAVTAHGKRAGSDLEALRDLADLQVLLDDVMRHAVANLRTDDGGAYSWTEIGRVLGISKQAAAQRFGATSPARPVGARPANLR